MTEVGCGRCGALMKKIRQTRKTSKWECPNCGRRIVVRERELLDLAKWKESPEWKEFEKHLDELKRETE